MNIEKQLQEDHSIKLIVDVEPEAMEKYLKRAARKISEQAKIPGFRPGKAPYDIVVRNFGEGAITEQAVDLFIDAEYSSILTQAEIEPGGSGTLESIDSLTPPKFTFKVPLAPQVDLGDYHSIRLPYEWKGIEESDIDAGLEDVRQSYATTENVDRAIESGDYVLLDVKSETTELNRSGFATFVRKEGRDTEWPYNGFAKELIGLGAGESKTIKHKFPADWEVAELQDKDVEIEATVKTVRGTILPDLDDELAKKTGAGETVADLREAVKKDITSRSQGEYDDVYFVELIEKIKAGATIKYHEHTLEHESEHVLQDLANRLSQQGMDMETYFKMRETTREEFVEKEIKPVSQKRLERGMILDEIVRKESLKIDNVSLDAEFNNAMTNLIMQGLDLNKMKGGKKRQQEITQAVAMDAANRVMTRKALDMIKSIAMDEYKPVEEEKAADAVIEQEKESE